MKTRKTLDQLVRTLGMAATAGALVFSLSAGARDMGGSTSGSTTGQTTSPSATEGMSFQNLDRNSDGTISKTEASNLDQLNTQFSQVDSDGDGAISRTEFSAFEAQQMGTTPEVSPGMDSGGEVEGGTGGSGSTYDQ